MDLESEFKNQFEGLHGGLTVVFTFGIGQCLVWHQAGVCLEFVIALLAIVVSGIPSGLTNIVSYAMIGDTIEYLELKTGERAEGICFAMQTFINKIGMAIGAFIGVMGYYLAGVTANNPGALDAGGKDVMWIMLMLVAALSFILSAIPIFFYKFNEKDQQEAVEEIKRRKEAQLAAQGAEGGAVELEAGENDIAVTDLTATESDVSPSDDAPGEG